MPRLMALTRFSTFKENRLLTIAPLLSLTWTVKISFPLFFGVPVMAPVDLLSVNPVRKAPDLMNHL